ncbi:MAG: NUDIX domain-containing protein [Nitrospira sp.]|nr:NUDIX domain-containing protein [Nitrospira sp.]MDH4245355.1 NUDIX domain-containing protein [Nitrospira sp.]MDH4355545.1 NUDIX domain-containing protein [Nitrospira sp.]MDH5317943.1 NUDIX domain-containing protein [Nitrospira sp.]
MGKKLSAGILLYRRSGQRLEVFLVHPGGPYWARKDHGAWSIPKGEHGEGEDALVAAKREFAEETSSQVTGSFHPLASLTQPSGKVVSAWAVEGDLDPATVRSNSFSLEWPPRSGRRQEFPEVDRGAWFDIPAAYVKLQAGQSGFLDRLQALLKEKVVAKHEAADDRTVRELR